MDGPTGNFVLLPNPCGTTRISPSQIETFVGEAQPGISLYRWTLIGLEGEVLEELIEEPGASIQRSKHSLGGTMAAPDFNLTAYRDQRLAQFVRSSGPEVPSLFHRMALTEGEYEVELLLRIPDTTKSVNLVIRNGSAGGDQYAEALNFTCPDGEDCSELRYHREVFTTNSNLSGTATNGMLQLVFLGIGTFLVDGVRLRAIATDEDLVDNDSFETAADWVVGNESTGSVSYIRIPDDIATYGEYRLEFQVIDALGRESPIVSRSVEHWPCS